MSLEFGRTSHGMEVFVDPMPGMQTARIALDVNVGSIHEQPGEEGLAHVLEHAVHLRTPLFGRKADLTRYQGIYAIDANAYTNVGHTEYHGMGPDVEPIVVMLGEITTRPQFVPEDIDPEMEVVTEEVRQRLNDYRLLHSLAIENTLIGGAYGRDITGHLKKLSYDTGDIRNFYGKYYTYDNMQLWGVGNVSLEQLVEYAEAHLTPLPAASNVPQKGVPGSSITEDMRGGYILERSETSYYTEAVQCSPDLREDIKAQPRAFEAAANILSDYVLDVLRNREGIAYGAAIFPYTYKDPNSWHLRASTTAAPEHLGRVEAGIAEVLSRPVADYAEEDIMAGIGACRGKILTTMDDINSRAELHREHLDWYGEPRELSEIARSVRGLSTSEVRRAMGRMLQEFAQGPKLTHVTGTAEAVGKADVIVEQDAIM